MTKTTDTEIEKVTLPDVGVTFWPVGNGDSSTVSISNEIKLQIDLHHMAASEDEDEEYYPVVDYLVESLPKKDDKPYLAAFALTHPDQDHIKGFSQLLEDVTIGELWFTPRIFNEFKKELCDEAVAFRNEAERRLKLVIKNNGAVDSGDRIRIFGYDSLLEKDKYKGLPTELLTIPGSEVTFLNGENHSDEFSAFIHSPFKAEDDDERNDTSLGMQITLGSKEKNIKILIFGDLEYNSLRKIFDTSINNDNADKLQWNILLAPHHCSKSIMYTKDDDDKNVFQQDIMDDIETFALEPGCIISSSKIVPKKNKKGDNPPHAIAKDRYEGIVPNKFLCTHGNSKEDVEPLSFENDEGELIFNGSPIVESSSKDLEESINDARGNDAPPSNTTGFGAY